MFSQLNKSLFFLMFSLKCSYSLSSHDLLLYCHVPHSAIWFAFWCSQHVGACGRSLYFGCMEFLFKKGRSEICAVEPLLCDIQSITLLGGVLVTDFEGLTSHFVEMSWFFSCIIPCSPHPCVHSMSQPFFLPLLISILSLFTTQLHNKL